MRTRKNQAMLAEFKKRLEAPAAPAVIPKGSEPDDQIPFRDAIKRIQLALRADWYYPREPFQLNGELITDFRATAVEYLKPVAEKECRDRIIALAMQIPPLRTVGKNIGDQLDRQLVNWRELPEASLCAIYWTAIKDGKAGIYEPLGKYLGFYQFKSKSRKAKSATAKRGQTFDKNWRDTVKHIPKHISKKDLIL